jgi:PAS domain S-box-containing protein
MNHKSAMTAERSRPDASRAAASGASTGTDIEALIGRAPMGFFQIDRDLRFVYVNEWIAAAHGVSAADHVGRRQRDVVPQIAAAVEDDLRKVLETGDVVEKQTLLTETAAHPGVKRYYQHTFSAARSPDGRIVGVNCFVCDVDELARAQERLSASEARSQEAQQMARIGLWEWNVLTNEDFWSEELYRLFGESPDTFSPSFDEVLARVVPEERERVRQAGYDAIEKREPFALNYEILCRDGTRRVVHSQGRIKTDDAGRVTGMIGTLHDITEQWWTEARLRASETRLREAQRMSKLGNWERNVVTGEVWWSEEALRIFGLAPDVTDPSGEAIVEAVHAEDRKLLIGSIERLLQHGEDHSIEYRVVRPDGSERIVHDHAKAVRDAAGRIVMLSGTVQDITKRKRIEQALQQSEFKYRTIVDTAHEGIMVVDREHRITYVNRRMAQMLGHAPEEMLGRSNLEFMDDKAREAARRKVSRRLSGMREQYDFGFVHADGSSISTRIAATPISAQDGSYVGSLLMVADVTEPRRLERQLRQAQKMEAVGQLTGGIAHDFNNLLTIVIGNLQLLELSVGQDEALRGQIDAALGAALRGAELTRRLLAFSRRQLLTPKVILVNELVGELAPLLRRTLGEDISIKTRLADDLWLTKVDASQLENALVNLAVNARDAMPGGGALTIETRNVTIGENFAGTNADLPFGDYVLIAVSDNGTGIEKELIPRVFDPFFSTKETGKGSGLGLSMVHGFVKQSRGDVSIYSEVGRGTTVRIYLPRSDSAAKDAAATSVKLSVVPSGTERILLVEDEPGVRQIGASVLRDLGYDVLEAEAADQALGLLQRHGGVDLLFTDIVMPGGMSGAELAREALHLYPKLKVLYTSGYTDNAMLEHGLLDNGNELLTKPYQKHELAQKVRAVLDQT